MDRFWYYFHRTFLLSVLVIQVTCNRVSNLE